MTAVCRTSQASKYLLTSADLNIPSARYPGLYIMSVEEGSAAERDGRLKLGDKILEVNGVDLSVMPPVR